MSDSFVAGRRLLAWHRHFTHWSGFWRTIGANWWERLL